MHVASLGCCCFYIYFLQQEGLEENRGKRKEAVGHHSVYFFEKGLVWVRVR